VVEIDPSRRPVAAELSWTDVRDHTVRDEFAEYLVQTPATAPPTELADLADSIVADNPPAQAAKLISAAVHDALTYRPGVTEVETPAAEAWAARSGVCQDYAHLVVGALRAAGMPARYVSGYLYPAVGPEVGESAVGESHAWVEWWLGRWVAFDPTNQIEVGNRHVLGGAGRDYGDVPPIRGLVAGGHSSTELDVTVELQRVA
jgi:transglutaminase-like putative cysteine protease